MICSIGMTAAACPSAPESDDELEYRDTACPNCGGNGSNSANANGYPIDQLNLYGWPNDAGVTVTGIKSPVGTTYALRTAGQELAAWDTATDTFVAVGEDLVGWTIKLHEEKAGTIDIEVVDHDMLESWATDGPDVSAYVLAYHNPDNPGELYSICPDPEEDGDDVIKATIVRGELYDDETKDITVNGEWITIACEENAVFKMKLLGYSPDLDFPGLTDPAPLENRQATIRMITADYCGGGHSFTLTGTHVGWENDAGTVTSAYGSAWADVEALWNEDGAICLSNPRYTTLGVVQNLCNLPLCTPQMAATVPHEWTTYKAP
ncbi:ADYC domain-containing protein [Nannocystis exedens]|uniref:ADYC domain-containing protein n=1 Tax=Nannocystis exedens TaxID=54 RepID=UPI001160CC0F|nr:ADYC domain-containing protein [Nannocystis exedens]